jgi:RNA polymerase sigma-70 factor (ECF subfamily)
VVTVTAVADDLAQVEAVYRQEAERLWRALLAFSRDPEIASDAVAEAFARAIRGRATIRDPQAWVWRTGFRIAAGELQHRSLSSSPMPDAGYFHTEADADLLDALAGLPEKQRTAVILFYYVDLPIREIANRTGMSQLSVRANLSRGRKRLKDLLGESR